MDLTKYSLTIEEFIYYYQYLPLVDTRSPDKLMNGYVRGSITIPDNTNLEKWIHKLIGQNQDFLLVDDHDNIEQTLNNLHTETLQNVKGFLRVGVEGWIKAEQPMDMLISIGTEELTLDFKHDNDIKLLDVRSKEDYGKGHLKNAINMPIENLENHLNYFSTDDKLYVYSQEGKESVIAVSLLRRHGYYYSRNIEPGFVDLQDTEITIVR